MDFEFLYGMIFNSYTVILMILFVVSIILLYEKRSFKYLIQNFIVIGIFYFYVKFIFLDYNIILLGCVTSLVINLLFSLIEFGLKKDTIISIVSQLIETICMVLMIIFIFMLRRRNINYEEFNDTNIRMIFACLGFISFMVFNKINIKVVNNLKQTKIKTEDTNKKEMYNNGINIGKEFLIANLSVYICYYIAYGFLAIMYINNIYIDGFFINEIGAEIVILALINLIIVIFAYAIPSYLNSCFNYKKEIYKKTSSNRVNDVERTLKL